MVEAYLRPEVEESDEPFTWSLPDLELLRQYPVLDLFCLFSLFISILIFMLFVCFLLLFYFCFCFVLLVTGITLDFLYHLIVDNKALLFFSVCIYLSLSVIHTALLV